MMRVFGSGAALLACFAAVAPAVAESTRLPLEQERIEAMRRATPSTVSIFVPGGEGGGSGVLVREDGLALTNFHVTSPAGAYMQCGLSDGNVYDAVVVGIDPVGDLAMIQLLGRDDFPVAELGDSDRVQVGDWCFVSGNPFLLASNLQPSVSWGIVSGTHRYQYPAGTLLEYADCLQTDAAINPGNSGGPLYDGAGRLIGIVGRASFEKRGRVNVGVGYAISINQAKNFFGYLQSGRIVDHATLGATATTDEDGRVRVSNILRTSDIYRRGVRYGDEILSLDGRAVTSANALKNILGTLPEGWRVKLRYRQDGQAHETLVRLDGVHQRDELLEKMAGALPPPPPREVPGGSESPEEDDDELPAAVEERYEARRGFANYWMNRQHRDRLVDALRASAPGGNAEAAAWEISGRIDGEVEDRGAPVTIAVGAAGLSIAGDGTRASLADASEAYEAIAQGGPEGLLACLAGWRELMAEGGDQFGEVYYVGTAPFLGERPLRDVLAAASSDLEYRFLWDADGRRPVVIECVAERDADPAELHLRWPDDDATMPDQLELRYGTQVVLSVAVESWGDGDAEPQE